MDELIAEAEAEPSWKAVSALRCAKKELLKEQEALKPIRDEFGFATCRECGHFVKTPDMCCQRFCSNCGRKQKWD